MSEKHQIDDNEVIIRNVTSDDIPKIIELQKISFPYMAADGVIWQPHHLESHIKIFPEGQFCAQVHDKIVASASSLVVTLPSEYADHSWKQITANGMFKNHSLNGDSLYGADVSTHPESRRTGVASMLYKARKELAIKMNLRRIIAGGRLFNYCEYSVRMSPEEYAQNIITGALKDPVLSFQLRNGFQFIKILPDYMKDTRSMNFASFIEWKNPMYIPPKRDRAK